MKTQHERFSENLSEMHQERQKLSKESTTCFCCESIKSCLYKIFLISLLGKQQRKILTSTFLGSLATNVIKHKIYILYKIIFYEGTMEEGWVLKNSYFPLKLVFHILYRVKQILLQADF